MKRPLFSRRLVLRGAGGVVLGLPYLPSVSSRAFAQAPPPPRQRRFVSMASPHGGVRDESMFPKDETLTERTMLFPGHEIARGPLPRTVEGTDAVVSAVLRAPASALSERLVRKMNVIQGLDIPFYISHNTGGHLGNYARNDGNGADGREVGMTPMPTVDQLMAWSSSFYRDLSGIKERVIVGGNMGGFSYNWSNPAARSGTIQEIKTEYSALALFDRIFVPASTTPPPARKPIVDRVLEDYRLLRNTNRRLSPSDRQRLDDHVARVAELQRRLGSGGTIRPMSCSSVRKPPTEAFITGTDKRRKYQLFNDVIVASFLCGTSNIAVLVAYDHYVPYADAAWHQDVAHNWLNAGPQQMLLQSNRNFFEWVFLDLIQKLDIEEVPGGSTFLDNTLVAWTQESGMQTHEPISIPVVTAGGAGGFLRTGQHIDYRNKQMTFYASGKEGKPVQYHGLTWNRWLGTVLQSMGIPRSDYERNGSKGYGHPFVGKDYGPKYVSGVFDTASEVLPFLSA